MFIIRKTGWGSLHLRSRAWREWERENSHVSFQPTLTANTITTASLRGTFLMNNHYQNRTWSACTVHQKEVLGWCTLAKHRPNHPSHRKWVRCYFDVAYLFNIFSRYAFWYIWNICENMCLSIIIICRMRWCRHRRYCRGMSWLVSWWCRCPIEMWLQS